MRSKRAALWGYLGDFAALIAPALYNSWSVLIEEGLRVISSSESDIILKYWEESAAVGILSRETWAEIAVYPCRGLNTSSSSTASVSFFSCFLTRIS